MAHIEGDDFTMQWAEIVDDFIEDPPEDCSEALMLQGMEPADLGSATTIAALIPFNEGPVKSNVIVFSNKNPEQSIREIQALGECEGSFSQDSGADAETEAGSERVAKNRVYPYAVLVIGDQEGENGVMGKYAMLVYLVGFDPKTVFDKITDRSSRMLARLLN